jgi:DNA polymerase-4
MERQIVHMDLDTFFVSVERLMDRRLEGRPLIIGGSSDRGVVSACSYEARRYGVHSAMPMRLAKRMCPDAVFLRGDHQRYSDYSDQVSSLLAESVPICEKASIDEFYIDMTGMDRYFGSFRMVSELRQRVKKEIGLPMSLGMSINKTVSKVATGQAKPNGQLQVSKGGEQVFLAPLPISKLPMIGDKTTHQLNQMGVFYLHTLQQMPSQLLVRVFGKSGLQMWERANGIDDSPVVPYSEQKSVSTEETFEQDTTDVSFLRARLLAMAEQLSGSLREQPRLTSCISVKIRYADFDTHSKQQRIPYTNSDSALIEKSRQLFDALYDRRLRVRLVGLRMSHLVPGGQQYHLFEDNDTDLRLLNVIDTLNRRYGDRTVCRAYGVTGRHYRTPSG